jgi:hypothetical protein
MMTIAGDAGCRQGKSRGQSVEDGVLTIEGASTFPSTKGLQPVYTEYDIGHVRSFQLSSKIEHYRPYRPERDSQYPWVP